MNRVSINAPPSVLVLRTAGATDDLSSILRDAGFEPACADTSVGIIEALGQRPFDAVLADARRPDSRLQDLLRTVCSLDERIPVVLWGSAAEVLPSETSREGRFSNFVEPREKPVGLVVALWRACHDGAVSRAVQLDADLRERDDMLAQSKAEIIDFAAVCAHDLRSPLLTVSGYCDLLRNEQGDGFDESARRYLQSISDALLRMNRLIDDLAAYARLGNGDDMFDSVDLDEVMAIAVSNLDGSIRRADAVVEIAPLPCAVGNRSRLIQVFQNLLDNAVKFQGDKRPAVRVSGSTDSEGVIVEVADNGIGIPAEHHETVFRVFQRLARSRDVPGTGMGLAICRRIIESHGGRIWIESEPDLGATFFVRLRSPGDRWRRQRPTTGPP